MASHSKDRALNDSKAFDAVHLVRYHDDDGTQYMTRTEEVAGKTYQMPNKDWIVRNLTRRLLYRPSDTAIPTNALTSNNAKIEFVIDRDRFFLHEAFIEMTIRNSSATTAQQLSPAMMLFDRVRLLGKGQAHVNEIHGYEMYLNHGYFVTAAQNAVSGVSTNLDVTYSAGAGIAAGSTVRYYARITDLFHKDTVFGLPLFNVDSLKVEAYFRGANAILVDSSAGDGLPLVLEDCQLLLTTTHVPSMEEINLSKIHIDHHDFKILYHNHQSFDQNLQPSQTYTFKLNSIRGVVPWAFIALRPQGHTGSNSFKPAIAAWIDRFEIREDNNTSITNSQQYRGDYFKDIVPMLELDSSFSFYASASYFIPFNSETYTSYKEAINTGFDFFKDNIVVITTKSTLVGGNYEVFFYVPSYSTMHIDDNGAVSREQ